MEYRFCVVVLGIWFAVGVSVVNCQTLEQLEQQIRNLRSRINNIHGVVTFDINALKSELFSIKAKLDNIGSIGNGSDRQGVGAGGVNLEEIIRLENDIDALRTDSKELRNTVAELNQKCSGDFASKEEVKELRTEVENLKEQLGKLVNDKQNKGENEFEDFLTTMKLAFKHHKEHYLHTFNNLEIRIKELENNPGAVEDNEIIVEINNQFVGINEKLKGADDRFNKLENELKDFTANTGQKLKECCTKTGGGGVIGGPDFGGDVTQKPEQKETVTLEPGGPRIYAVYREEIPKHIKIGSRVIRGEDWIWGNQDGNGPGTVDAWYGANPATQQVMVRWDSGRRANYRVGSLGKYDLYLLAE